MKHDNDNDLPASQDEARRVGSKYYRAEKPCQCGKVVTRYTSCGACVPCAVERAKARYAADPQAKKEYDAERYQNNPKARVGANKWRLQNPDKMRACRLKWKANNPEKHKAAQVAYAKNNPDAVMSNARARRARKRGADGVHKASDIASILKRQKFKCAECSVSVRDRSMREVDHIMPLVLGGSNWPSNLQVLCQACNRKKGGLDPIDFAQKRGRLV